MQTRKRFLKNKKTLLDNERRNKGKDKEGDERMKK
jgi:hypothetical protein